MLQHQGPSSEPWNQEAPPPPPPLVRTHPAASVGGPCQKTRRVSHGCHVLFSQRQWRKRHSSRWSGRTGQGCTDQSEALLAASWQPWAAEKRGEQMNPVSYYHNPMSWHNVRNGIHNRKKVSFVFLCPITHLWLDQCQSISENHLGLFNLNPFHGSIYYHARQCSSISRKKKRILQDNFYCYEPNSVWDANIWLWITYSTTACLLSMTASGQKPGKVFIQALLPEEVSGTLTFPWKNCCISVV